MVGVPGTAARLFKCLADAGINIMLITQGSSEYSISFAILPEEVRKASLQIQNEFRREFERNDLDHLHIENELSILAIIRSEEHTSELQSRGHLVCRLLLEKKKNKVRIRNMNKKHMIIKTAY